MLGLAGTAPFYGDGATTPAISVLSAIEGLDIATDAFKAWVVPPTVVVLVALFLVQGKGTGRIGAAFGPIMMVWFAALAVPGIGGSAGNPVVLTALVSRRARLFTAMYRNAGTAADHFRLPPNRVVELGAQVSIQRSAREGARMRPEIDAARRPGATARTARAASG